MIYVYIIYSFFLYVAVVDQILKSVVTCWGTGLLFMSVISLRCHIHNGQHFIQSPFQRTKVEGYPSSQKSEQQDDQFIEVYEV